MTSDVVNIKPEPSLLSPEREREIYESSRAAGKKIADVLVTGMELIAAAKRADTAAEIAALKARVERLERLLSPREVDGGEAGK
jgi:hypothetical protein